MHSGRGTVERPFATVMAMPCLLETGKLRQASDPANPVGIVVGNRSSHLGRQRRSEKGLCPDQGVPGEKDWRGYPPGADVGARLSRYGSLDAWPGGSWLYSRWNLPAASRFLYCKSARDYEKASARTFAP